VAATRGRDEAAGWVVTGRLPAAPPQEAAIVITTRAATFAAGPAVTLTQPADAGVSVGAAGG
jgi:hypothetical protein